MIHVTAGSVPLSRRPVEVAERLDVAELVVLLHRVEARQRVPDARSRRALWYVPAEHLAVRAVGLAAVRHVVAPAHVVAVQEPRQVGPRIVELLAVARGAERRLEGGLAAHRVAVLRAARRPAGDERRDGPAGSTSCPPRTCGPEARSCARSPSSSGSRASRGSPSRRAPRASASSRVVGRRDTRGSAPCAPARWKPSILPWSMSRTASIVSCGPPALRSDVSWYGLTQTCVFGSGLQTVGTPSFIGIPSAPGYVPK